MYEATSLKWLTVVIPLLEISKKLERRERLETRGRDQRETRERWRVYTNKVTRERYQSENRVKLERDGAMADGQPARQHHKIQQKSPQGVEIGMC